MKIADVPDMLDALKQGDLRIVDVEGLLLDLLVENEVNDVLSCLPNDIGSRLQEIIRKLFAEDLPVEDIVIFDSARGMHPQIDRIIASARRWLRLSSRA